jgi:hypothetical protein
MDFHIAINKWRKERSSVATRSSRGEVEEVTTRAPESTADDDDDIQAPPVKTVKPKTARFIVDITRSKPKRVQSQRKKTFKKWWRQTPR